MKKRLLSVALLMGAWGTYGQVGIGTLTPDNSSQLDVVANDKGILIPRISLTSTTDATTIKNGNVNSLLVFNTNTQNDITPGYYYWYDNKWMRIVNEDEVTALDKNTTNVSLTVVGDELVLTDSENNIVSIPLSEINIPTTVVKNTDGTYTYTNEAGDTVTIDATDNVISNFENIVNNTNVLNELIEVLGDTYVGGNVNYDGTEFTYIDQAGDTHVVNIQDIVQANETVTTIVKNTDGTYTYTNEAGDTVTIDATDNVISNFENIVNNTNVLNELIEVLGDTYVGGNVNYDGTEFTYIDQAGDTHVVNIQDIVQAKETVTTIVKNTDGTYTYTNEAGDTVTIDATDNVISNFENIVNNTNVLNELIEVLGDTYVGGNVNYDGTEFTYIDQAGDTHVVNIQDIVQAKETVTTIVKNTDGTYTYTNEAGDTVTIDATDNVISNFENIVNNTNVLNELIEVLGDTYVGGNVYYDGTQFTYVDQAGDTHIVNIQDVVTNEVVNNIVNQGDIYDEIINLLEQETDILTDNGDGTYTHTAVDGTPVIIDANTTSVTIVDGVYTFLNGNGDTITTIDTNADAIAFDNSTNDFTSDNVQEALEELKDTIETNKGNLSIAGGLEFTGATNGNAKLLADAGIQIADGGITNVKLGADAVTNDKLADNAVQSENILDGTIATADLANGAVTEDKILDGAVAPEKLSADPADQGKVGVVQADGTIVYENLDAENIDGKDLTAGDGSILVTDGTGATLVDANVRVADGGITNVKLGADAVTNDKLADNAVQSENILDGTIATADLASGAVTEDKILDGAVAPEKLSADPADQGKVGVVQADGTIVYENLDAENIDGKDLTAGDGSILVTDGTGATLVDANVRVADGGITNVKLGADAVTNDKLADNAVQSENILDGTIATADLANGAVTEDKILDGAVAPEKLSADPADQGKVGVVQADGTVVYENINASDITGTENLLVFNGIEFTGTTDGVNALLVETGIGIADGGITTDKLADNAVTTVKLNNGAVTATKMNAETAPDGAVPTSNGDGTVTYKEVPRFFYMPAVIFDTSAIGNNLTRDLYQDYVNQFTGGDPNSSTPTTYNIAHGATGHNPMPYSGGIIGSNGAPDDIIIYSAGDMFYYITYYDEAVFAGPDGTGRPEISATGELQYSIIGNATETSYMNIVFVIK